MQPEADIILEIRDVSLTRGAFHLQPMRFAIGADEVLAIIGQTGSGKTMLLELMAGFHPPDAGAVLLNGRDMRELALHERKIGYLYQEYCLFPHMTAAENIAYGLRMKKVGGAACRERVHEIAKQFGICHLLTQYPSTLSGGEQQRTALTRALITHPLLLLLDEPFSALDPVTKESMYEMIRRIRAEYHCAIAFVTHDFHEAAELADRVGILLHGTMQAIVPAKELFTHPWNEATKKFLGITK